jgi:two-component system sensor histidine kinase/response regulator
VLLAEDNPINQEVALELLRGAGLHADLAADGAQAVALARAAPYDLILMDMQMPVLDGLEATALIRALPGYAATPILALTANAFGEDRARCLAAGMNDHVGKPVDPAVLFAALLRWLPPGAAPPIPAADAGADPAAGPRAAADTTPQRTAPLARLAAIPGLDTALALRHLAGRVERLAHLLRVFADSHREAPARLRERLDCGDGDGARRIAHGLKGAAATLGATAIQAQALDLELALREARSRAELEPLIERLEETLGALLDALRAALEPGTASEG